jgi:pyruvate/2-oxoglutarate dehydrogenase complex dihydrolipoamide dehydrogenase (E3) component
MKILGVELILNENIPTDAQKLSALFSEIAPDCVVLATGSRPNRDGMQSFNYSRIKGHEFGVTIEDVLAQKVKVGGKVVILDESGFVEGLALSHKLATSGSNVELVTRDVAPGLDLQWSLQIPYLYENALKRGVIFTPNSFIRELGADFAIIYNIYTGTEVVRDGVDTVILNTGRSPRDDLYPLLTGVVREVHTIGDCNLAGRQIGDAITEAFDVARTI